MGLPSGLTQAGFLGCLPEAGGGLSGQGAEVVVQSVPTRGLATGRSTGRRGAESSPGGPRRVALARCTALSEVNAAPAEGSVMTCD